MRKDRIDRKGKWEMRPEYDFSNARPNPFAKKYAEGTNVVLIDTDLLHFFPDSASVNTALRAIVSLFPKGSASAKRSVKKNQKRTGAKQTTLA